MRRFIKWGVLAVVGIVILAGIVGVFAGDEGDDAAEEISQQDTLLQEAVTVAQSPVTRTEDAPGARPAATLTSAPTPELEGIGDTIVGSFDLTRETQAEQVSLNLADYP